jgi:NAD+ kinase
MHPGKSFQTIGIISRPRRSNLDAVVPPLLQWLEAHGVQALYDEETAGSLPHGPRGKTRQEVADLSQLLLVLGGDGTLLAAARLAAPRAIPILPINMGSLGFLTSFTLEELYPALEDCLGGRFSVSERIMLHVELERAGKVIESQSVLNVAVINKGALPLPRRWVDRREPHGIDRLFPFRRRSHRSSGGRSLHHHSHLPAHAQRPPSSGSRFLFY